MIILYDCCKRTNACMIVVVGSIIGFVIVVAVVVIAIVVVFVDVLRYICYCSCDVVGAVVMVLIFMLLLLQDNHHRFVVFTPRSKGLSHRLVVLASTACRMGCLSIILSCLTHDVWATMLIVKCT